MRLFATCGAGLEELLAGELGEMGVAEPRPERGAVAFAGGWRDVWRANWRLRTANRVLVELGSWEAPDGAALRAGAERLVTGDGAWDGVTARELFSPDRTLAVRATAGRSPHRDTRWIALAVKDGLVDGQRRRHGRRASVSREDPDLPLRVRVDGTRATLLLDTSGLSLDHRGYRVATVAAPVREQLAAACVLAARWDGRGPVVDPMCGSGTLLAEAGAWALGLAPGRARRHWGLERLPGFSARAWERVRREPLPVPAPDVGLLGRDLDPRAIEAAGRNLAAAGLRERTDLAVGDAFSLDAPGATGLLLVNPAYGERLAADADQWPRLGDLLKRQWRGWRAVVLAGGEDQGKHIGLRPTRRLPVRSGPLAARILVFDLY